MIHSTPSLTDTANSQPIQSEAGDNGQNKISVQAERRFNIRKWGWRFAIVLVAGIVVLPFLLAGLAAFLIYEDVPEQATVAIPFGGEEAYHRVKDLLNEQVEYAGVLDFVPNRLVERGVAPAHREIMQDMYDRLEIPEERRWLQPGQAQLFSGLLVLLGKELEQESLDSVIIVCNAYRSRWVKSKLADNLPKSQADRIFIVPVDPYDFTVWNWWRSSHGRRTVITELIDYLAYQLSDKKGTEEWLIRSPEELKKAALVDGNAG